MKKGARPDGENGRAPRATGTRLQWRYAAHKTGPERRENNTTKAVAQALWMSSAGRAAAVPVLPVHEPPPPSSGRVHFRGARGSACGHLGDWHLKNAPHRFSEDASQVTCAHCRNGHGRPQCRPVAPPPVPSVAPGPKVHLRATARSPACSSSPEAPVGRYVGSDDPREVTCERCRRTVLWQSVMKKPSELARTRRNREAYEEHLRAAWARAPVTPAPRVVPVCHMLEGGETRH